MATDGYFKNMTLLQIHRDLRDVRDKLASENKKTEFDTTVGAKFTLQTTLSEHDTNKNNDVSDSQKNNTEKSRHPKQPFLNQKRTICT